MIRVVIADDEPLAREGVRMALRDVDDVVIVAECRDGGAAVRAILSENPDLVFLDIRMPQLDGLEVTRAIGQRERPLVVFLTAFDEHAVEAFGVHAFDYLLKPLDPDRLSNCVARVRKELKKSRVAHQAEQLAGLLHNETGNGAPSADRITVRTGGHLLFIKPAEITSVESNGDYVTIHSANREHLLRDTMLNMEKRLHGHGFCRIHRSTIVNLEEIAELIARDTGDYQVLMKDGRMLKLSRSYRDKLFQALDVSP